MKERNQKLMFKRKDFQLPVHSLETDSKHINILPLDHNNPYDHKREHRHTYFELMFIEGGGGNQEKVIQKPLLQAIKALFYSIRFSLD